MCVARFRGLSVWRHSQFAHTLQGSETSISGDRSVTEHYLLVFLLQVLLLLGLARGMSNENVRIQLTQANTSQEVWQALQDALGTQKLA
jgi:hypothetical protein